ncbi:putative lectin family integral membrane protein [Cladophialophora carrionii]|uniref:Putative lectin family integral membrane protein n=1 Tax=Cladophialophora carrionii TaxID=86049 RepID=A0A1C1CCK3_9EURO|nr:putative lectin family integral membrane protein [Cladophialophora carrionii]
MKVALSAALVPLLWATASFAQNVIEDMSFGHKNPLSPNSFAIPGWAMLGEGHVPQLLSDKVILTPPYGGHKRGALWAEQKNTLQDWEVDFKFRAGGQDRASGSLQLWYVANGDKSVSTSSLSSVGKWDGLAIVTDTVGGVQKIRGFLNDGSVEYKSHQNVDGIAFGHCDYVYRNLGRPSHLKVRHTRAGGLEVRIDDKPCFATGKVSLPTEYSFGMTAASADPPDSFEVFTFTLSSVTTSPPPTLQNTQPPPTYQNQQAQPQGGGGGGGMFQPDDTPASHYTTSEAQFADLHNRLNLLSKSISNLFTELQRMSSTLDTRQNELLSRMPSSQSISALDTRVANLDRVVSSLEKELKSSDHRTQFAKISEQIAETHLGVTEHVPQRLREYVIAHTPRIGFVLYSFMAFQTCCIAGFVWYKWRKSTMPKKYL